jgi:hypothetical protein
MKSPHRTSNISGKKAKASLSMLLSGCTRERLAEFTPEKLAAQFNVRPAVVEQMLAQARQGRLGV